MNVPVVSSYLKMYGPLVALLLIHNRPPPVVRVSGAPPQRLEALRTTADEAERLSDLLGDEHDRAILNASLDQTPALTDKQRTSPG